MAMTSKVAELKQSLSFKSLRLMEWKESQGSSMRSFSDSEAINCGSRSAREEVTKSKSKSETNLNTLTITDGKADKSYDFLKAFSNSNPFILRSKKAEIGIELKSVNTDFHTNVMQGTSLESEAQIPDDLSNRTQISLESSGVCTDTTSGEKDMAISITENSKPIVNVSNAKHYSDTMGLQNSSPYPVLEGEQSSTAKTELILGEPRCLTLKKNDADPFLTDDPLIFEPDFEDDNRIFNKKPTLPKKVERKLEKFVSDMFVDEDELNTFKKKGLLVDREEGELTPEAPHKSSGINKIKELSSGEKKAAFEFFNKINECLRELNDKCREFYSSSTPEYSLTHLQRTLGNVDNIKRKLAFLIKSKNTEKEERDKEKKSAHKSHSNMKLYSERFSKSNSTVNDDKSGQEKQEHYSGLKNDVEELYRQLKENREKRNSENTSRHGHRRERSSRDNKPSQADLLNRKKISMLEKLGTKQEIERVQSLFKRQMNLITQHVIQKKETEKKHTYRQEETQKRRRRRYSSQSQDGQESKKSRDRTSLNDLKTLEDMEAFLNSLKKDKMLCEQYISDQKSKGMLKFSSKKQKRVASEASHETPPEASAEILKYKKGTFKPPLSKEDLGAAIPKSNKNQEENLTKVVETKQKVDKLKMKNPKISTSIAASGSLSRLESSDHPKKADVKYPNPDSRSKIELSKSTDRIIDPESPMNQTQTYRENQCDLNTKLKTSGLSKGEIKLKEVVESKHKSQSPKNISEKSEQDHSKRKRDDLSDSNFNKSENEKEEKSCKKQKVTKYLAARKITKENQPETKFNTRDEKTDVGTAESLVKDLLSRKIVILDDNGVALNNEFCIKVIDNEVFLKKVSNKRKRKHFGKPLKPRQSKNIKRGKKDQPAHKQAEAKPKLDQRQLESKLDQEIIEPKIDPETIDTTLNEMENFLQDLRSKRKVRDDETHQPIEKTSQNREMKFLARIQAKRKAKLMACVSDGIYSTEKEAKFLKALEKRDEEVSESSDVETRKQAFLEKIRAEKDAIAEKPKAKQNDDDPLKDVKAFLDMIKEAESGNDENAKQVYVSFSLKRSDVKKLENLTTGKASLLSEESQKFLNSVRSKMKAKKTPASGLGALMRKPEA